MRVWLLVGKGADPTIADKHDALPLAASNGGDLEVGSCASLLRLANAKQGHHQPPRFPRRDGAVISFLCGLRWGREGAARERGGPLIADDNKSLTLKRRSQRRMKRITHTRKEKENHTDDIGAVLRLAPGPRGGGVSRWKVALGGSVQPRPASC
jgi:hypothetical protein